MLTPSFGCLSCPPIQRVIIFIFALSSGLAQSAEVSVIVQGKGGFDVLFHRAKSTATGAVIGGLIGAGIEEGVLSNKDAKKKKELLVGMEEPSCSEDLISTLVSRLEEKKFMVTLHGRGDKRGKNLKGYLVEIDVKKCGFKLVNSDTEKISAFVEFKSRIYEQGEKKRFENNLFLGKKSYSYEELLGMERGVTKEIAKVLSKSGKRMANKLIYSKRES